MYDLHNHVLPAVDDGAMNMRIAIRMLEQAVAQGITHVACTPHLNDRTTPDLDRRIQSVFLDLQEEVLQRALPVELMLGSEIMLGADLQRMVDLPIATYGGKGRYLLFEFPTSTPHEIALNAITVLRRWGRIPVLAHIERFTSAVKSKDHALALRNAGAVLSLDGGSLLGQFGHAMSKRAEAIVGEELIDIMMSDAHNDAELGFCLKGAFEVASLIIGSEKAKKMVVDHPRIIWENEPWPGLEI